MALVLTACASIGRPEGGPRDERPPEFVRANPMPGTLNSDRRTINIYFNENVQLDDAFNKVIVSPVQKEAARVSANGKRVTVQLNDTLLPNTTYTVDFADAIKDLNEGNILDGFAIDFSTGDVLDSMRISGIVMAAQNLEPAQGVIVAAYSNLSDTAIRTESPARIARTNQYGQFTIRNLAPGTPYRLYAINDVNRDWHWDRSEDVAFLDSLITPVVREFTLTDTIYASDGSDSLIQRRGIQYLPNDLLFTWFNEGYTTHYLKEYSRPDRRTISLELSTPPDSLYEVRIVDGPADSTYFGRISDEWGVHDYSAKRDSLTLWIADTTVLHTDSLRLSVRYLKTDTADRLVWKTDTLRFFYREPKRSKKEIEADTLPPKFDKLTISAVNGSTQDIHLPFRFKVDQPLQRLDTAGVRFEMSADSVWTPIKGFKIQTDSLNPVLGMLIENEWVPGNKYRVEIDSASFIGIYDEYNPVFKQEFTIKNIEDYSNLYLTMEGVDSTAVVELLNTSDDPVARAPVIDGKASFTFLNPGTYYARMFFDTDRNGIWTTGILDSIQPEEVAYYPSKIELKRNWDIEQTWDIYATPIDRQKPYAILKNKPKLKRGEKAPVDEDEYDEDDPFADPWMNTGNSNKLNNRSNNGLGGGMNGFQQIGRGFR